jgi:polyhydroxybutyrate depolymerase
MVRQTLMHDGLEREYFVYLPSSYEAGGRFPVVIGLHGYLGTATGFALSTTGNLNRHAEANDYVAVYPQGTHFKGRLAGVADSFVSSWNTIVGQVSVGPKGPMCVDDPYEVPCPPECGGTCGQCGWVSCHDDVGYIDRLLDKITSTLTIDADRLYLAGMSTGGMMAYRLACELPGRFAAIANVNGQVELGFTCDSVRDTPALFLSGSRDTNVPPLGGDSGDWFYETLDEITLDWARSLACESDAVNWQPPGLEEKGLDCRVFRDCGPDNDKEVISCLDPAGAHHWPGMTERMARDDGYLNGYCVADVQRNSIAAYPICTDANSPSESWGNDLIWGFLSKYSR